MSCHRNVIVAALLIELVGALAQAQSITGTVESAKKPVVGATVQLLELDRVQRTGARGEFEFTNLPKGRYTLFVGARGYAAESRTIELTGAATTAALDLKLSAVALRKIVVSASPTPRATTDEYQSVDSKSQVDFLNSSGMNF